DGRVELLDHADRLVADGAALLHGIFALEDVDVGAADRRGRDADERIERPDIGNRLLVQHDAAGLDENRRLHLLLHERLLLHEAGGVGTLCRPGLSTRATGSWFRTGMDTRAPEL